MTNYSIRAAAEAAVTSYTVVINVTTQALLPTTCIVCWTAIAASAKILL
jgi:hypothetical protein